MPEVNVNEIDAEVKAVIGALQTSWSDFAIYCKAKIFEAGINGGVASYTLGDRTVQKDLDWWERTLALCQRQASVERSGGIEEQPIFFRSR